MENSLYEHIYQSLYARRQEIAHAWLALLQSISPIRFDIDEHLGDFTEHVGVLITTMTASDFDPSAAIKVGEQLVVLDNFQLPALLEVLRLLSGELLQGLTEEETLLLQPRLIESLGACIAGYFFGKAAREKRFNMDAMSKMGHDLKTPINAITGFSKVILKGIDGPITEFQQQDLTSIYEGGRKLLAMINDVFEVAKADTGKSDLYPEVFDVAALLGDVMTTAQPILARHEHTLTVSGVRDLGTMKADASEVRWILLSVLFYASRGTEGRELALVASRERLDGSSWLNFEITAGKEPLSGEITTRSSLIAGGEEEPEIGLLTAQKFCDDMGGVVVLSVGADHYTKVMIKLPAYVRKQEAAGEA